MRNSVCRGSEFEPTPGTKSLNHEKYDVSEEVREDADIPTEIEQLTDEECLTIQEANNVTVHFFEPVVNGKRFIRALYSVEGDTIKTDWGGIILDGKDHLREIKRSKAIVD